MESVKKLEIITNSLEMQAVLKILEKAGVSGYTVIENVTGSDRGIINDLATQALSNDYVMSICTEEQEHELVEIIRPILKKFGEVCIVSEAKWITH